MTGVRIEKPRLFQSTKDILLTLGVLLLVTFFTVGFTGLCSFNPGGPDKSGPVREVDAHSFLTLEARGMNFPLREPKMPEGWVPNSARRSQVGAEPAPLVGWVIDGERYISLRQTSADFKAATQPDQHFREAAGTEEAGGLTWHVYKGEDARPIWVADAGETRLILEGMASHEDMATAAEITAKTKPLEVSAESQSTGEHPQAAVRQTPELLVGQPVTPGRY